MEFLSRAWQFGGSSQELPQRSEIPKLKSHRHRAAMLRVPYHPLSHSLRKMT